MTEAARKPAGGIRSASSQIADASKIVLAWSACQSPLGVSLSLEKGEFVSIVGPSGCGKTTLFDIIAGLTQPDSGAVFVDGHDRTGQTGYVSYMPQEDLLLPWRTTLENAMLAPELGRTAVQEARSEVRRPIELFGCPASGFVSVRAIRRHAAKGRTRLDCHVQRAMFPDETLSADAIR